MFESPPYMVLAPRQLNIKVLLSEPPKHKRVPTSIPEFNQLAYWIEWLLVFGNYIGPLIYFHLLLGATL